MPELVEVENYRQLLLRLCADTTSTTNTTSKAATTKTTQQQSLSVECPSTKPPKIFPSESEIEILRQCFVTNVQRKGKLLRLVITRTQQKKKDPTNEKEEDDPGHQLMWLYLHMGMTGRISTPDYIPSLESLRQTESFPPPHTHLILKVNTKSADSDEEEGTGGSDSGGVTIAYSDPRKFGFVRLCTNKNDDEEQQNDKKMNSSFTTTQWNELAPDALDLASDDDEIKSAAHASFQRIINQRRGIKGLLLDQRFAVSGIGNWIADEVLYQSKIHPDQTFLTLEEVHTLEQELVSILRIGIDCLVHEKQPFPAHWIFHRRWSKKKKTGGKKKGKRKKKDTNIDDDDDNNNEEEDTGNKSNKREKTKDETNNDLSLDAGGEPISFVTSASRSSCIVPSIQKKQRRQKRTEEDNKDTDDGKEEPHAYDAADGTEPPKKMTRKD